MERRDFLKLAAGAGLSVLSAPMARAFPSKDSLFRESSLYSGTFFVCVNAGGGWDPTSLCDPKGMLDDEVDNPEANPMNRSYLASAIQETSGIRYAPVGYNTVFFNRFASELLVLNGIDTSTNGHDSGSRHVWSGKLAEGHPSLGALLAGIKSRSSPMAFLSNGGYDVTSGLVAPTRSGGTDALSRLAFPNRDNPGDVNSRFHHESVIDRIRNAQRARLNRQRGTETLPRVKDAYGTLFAARSGETEVQALTGFLPETLDNSNNPLRRQAQVAIASYKAGLTVAANLNIGGFDTHGNHDAQHIASLTRLLEGIEFLMDEAERQGVRDRMVVVVGSDFGRTPGYNDGNGKDHWPITSMMIMGAGVQGGRVIGGSDHGHNALKINPSTLQVDEGGVPLTPGHIHRALRQLAGIDTDAIAAQFPIAGEDLGLL